MVNLLKLTVVFLETAVPMLVSVTLTLALQFLVPPMVSLLKLTAVFSETVALTLVSVILTLAVQ
jgi:hypothetical protein